MKKVKIITILLLIGLILNKKVLYNHYDMIQAESNKIENFNDYLNNISNKCFSNNSTIFKTLLDENIKSKKNILNVNWNWLKNKKYLSKDISNKFNKISNNTQNYVNKLINNKNINKNKKDKLEKIKQFHSGHKNLLKYTFYPVYFKDPDNKLFDGFKQNNYYDYAELANNYNILNLQKLYISTKKQRDDNYSDQLKYLDHVYYVFLQIKKIPNKSKILEDIKKFTNDHINKSFYNLYKKPLKILVKKYNPQKDKLKKLNKYEKSQMSIMIDGLENESVLFKNINDLKIIPKYMYLNHLHEKILNNKLFKNKRYINYYLQNTNEYLNIMNIIN